MSELENNVKKYSLTICLFSVLLFSRCKVHKEAKKGSIEKVDGSYEITSVKQIGDTTQALITGHVIDKHTGNPVYLCFISSKNGTESVHTDRDGYYKLVLSGGSTIIVAQALSHDQLETKPIDVKKGKEYDLDFYLGVTLVH